MKEELRDLLRNKLPKLTHEQIDYIIDESISYIESPEQENKHMELITIDKITGKGNSWKPENILFEFPKLLKAIPDTTLSILGSSYFNLFLPLALLIIWNRLSENMNIELSEVEAVVIKSMWESKEPNLRYVKEDKAYETTNKNLAEIGIHEITKKYFDRIVQRLADYRCIEKLNASSWYLREFYVKT